MILDRSIFFCISMQKYLMDVLKSFEHNLKTFDRNALNALVSFHSHIWKILSSRHPYHKYCDCIFFQKKVQPRWLRDAKNTTRRSLGVVTEETYKAQKKTIIERTDWARYHRKNTHRIFDRALIRSSTFLTVGRRARSSNFACSSATKTLLARESLPLSFTMHPISKVLHARPEPVTQFPPLLAPLPRGTVLPARIPHIRSSPTWDLLPHPRIPGRKEEEVICAKQLAALDRSFDRVDSRRSNPTTVLVPRGGRRGERDSCCSTFDDRF